MEINPTSSAMRAFLAQQTETSGEKGRKYESFKQWEIYSDKIEDYVKNHLREQYDLDTVKEMPVQYSINLSKRLVNQAAVVYKSEPKRQFLGLTEQQEEAVQEVYKIMRVDKKLSMANKGYELQDQSHIWIVPKRGKLQVRVLKNHQITVIPSKTDPEVADAYVVTAFDKQDFVDQDNAMTATGYQGKVDQFDEAKKNKERVDAIEADENKLYIVWTREFNWAQDAEGNVIGDILPNPLFEFGLMPFVDISAEKEFEYWVRQGQDTTHATVQFNANVLTEVANTIKYQAFAQAVLKGPEELMTENIRIGPTYLLKLVQDANSEVETSFEYKNTGADIASSLQWVEAWLSLYLTSRGLNPEVVNSTGAGQTATSGLDRLLQMIQQLSASSESFEVFARAEQMIWDLIRAWLIVLDGADDMDDAFKIGSLPEQSKISIKFHKPEMVQSESELLSNADKRIELGMSSPIQEIMSKHDVDRDKAEEMFNQFQEDNRRFLNGEGQNARNRVQPEQDNAES